MEMILKEVGEAGPMLSASAMIADTAVLVGNVTIGDESVVWYGAVLRGDIASVRVGNRSNVQEQCVVHVSRGQNASIGDRVTVGHGAILHGCTVEDDCLIGMGAILLDGVQVGHHSIIGAGALVTKGTVIPPGSLVLGSPGKVIRPLTEPETESIHKSAEHNYLNALLNFGQ